MIREVKLTTDKLEHLSSQFTVREMRKGEMVSLDNLFMDPTCQACFHTIGNFLSGGGMRVTKSNRKEFQVAPKMQQELDSVWMNFGKQIIKHIWIYGFVLVDVDEDNRPFVLEPLMHDIYVVVGERGYVRVQVRTPDGVSLTSINSRILSTPRCFVDGDFHPSGEIRSRIHAVRQMNSFQAFMLSCTAKAAQSRSQPPLFLEHNALQALEKEQARDTAQVGDSAHILFARSQGMDEKDYQQIRVNEENTRRLGREMEMGMDREYDPISRVMRYPVDGKNYYHNRIIIEQGKHIASGPSAETPIEIVPFLNLTEADICKILCIPPELLGSQRDARQRVNEMMMVIFSQTLNSTKQWLAIIFVLLLNQIYGQQNQDHTLRHLDPTRSVDENVDDHSFQVNFPGMLDMETLAFFLENGIMDFKTLTTYYAATCGAPKTDFPPRQLEVSTGRALGDVITEQRAMEQKAAETQDKVGQEQIKTQGVQRIKTLADTAMQNTKRLAEKKAMEPKPPKKKRKTNNGKSKPSTSKSLKPSRVSVTIDLNSKSKK